MEIKSTFYKRFLFGRLFYIKPKRNRTDQSTPRVIFYSVLLETTNKPSKEAAEKPFFYSVYVMDTTYFDEGFLANVISGTRHFSLKACRSFGIFSIFFNVLIQNIWFKTKNTESTERRCRKCRSTKTCIKQNNDHTSIIPKVWFRSSFEIKSIKEPSPLKQMLRFIKSCKVIFTKKI